MEHALRNRWPSRPDGTSVLAEYRTALEIACVTPTLLSYSPTHSILLWLRSSQSPRESIDLIIRDLVVKAWSLPPNRVESFFTHIAALDVSANVFNDCRSFANSLTWETPYLGLALRQLMDCEDAGGLQLIAGLMCRASRECAARKRSVFSTIINRVAARMPQRDDQHAGLTPVHPHLAAACPSHPSLSSSVRHLQAVCTAVVCDVKDRALESVFIQPALMTAEKVRDDGVSTDVDVHGGPVFLALLEACLGVYTSRLCEYGEEAKGLADVIAAGYGQEVLREMWADKNLGKTWGAIPACRQARAPPSSHSVSHVFVWRGGGGRMNVQAFADQAVNSSTSNAGNRARLATYLEAYCRYLSEGPFLQRLFSAVTVGSTAAEGWAGLAGAGSASGGAGDSLQHLQVLFDWMKAQPAGSLPIPPIPSDIDDVRYWLWDLDLDLDLEGTGTGTGTGAGVGGALNVQAARGLFSIIGIVKPAGWRLVENTAASDAAVATPVAPSVPSAPTTAPRIPPASITLTAAGDVRGGGTGREVLRNLHNSGTQGWDKWVHPGYVTSSWVHARLSGPYLLQAYSLCSANDCPHRDPVAWRVMGKRQAGEWVTLHEYPESRGSDGWESGPFMERWQWMHFTVVPPHPGQSMPVTEVRLEITAVRQPGDCVQLGHWHLYGLSAHQRDPPTLVRGSTSVLDRPVLGTGEDLTLDRVVQGIAGQVAHAYPVLRPMLEDSGCRQS